MTDEICNQMETLISKPDEKVFQLDDPDWVLEEGYTYSILRRKPVCIEYIIDSKMIDEIHQYNELFRQGGLEESRNQMTKTTDKVVKFFAIWNPSTHETHIGST